MKTNVLVFPCGSEIGLEIHRSLRWSNHVEVLGASSVSSNHGKYVYDNYIEGLPYVEDHHFIDMLNSTISAHDIALLFPAHDSVVLKLSESQHEVKCKIIGSPVETCRICRSKRKTYELFTSKLRVPRIYEPSASQLTFPIFLKPDVGQGSKGTFVAHSKAEVDFYVGKDPSLLLLEYLPGPEYTVDCFTDRHGILRFAGARERIRTHNGISVDTRPISGGKYRQLAETINGTLQFRGAWFYQVKKTKEGDLALMEIAPRIAGGMGLYRGLGVNFALLSVFDAMDFDVEILCDNYGIQLDRALDSVYKLEIEFGHVYMDFDDCLVIDGKVNTIAVSFLYKCMNKGIRLHLVTRHEGNLYESLSAYHLISLFDTVDNVKRSESKADYITEKSSIFIDDSFKERLDIKRRLGIPVFAPDAIETLV